MDLFPLAAAATELLDIGNALKNQDEAWFKGNQSLGDQYITLSKQLAALKTALDANSPPHGPTEEVS